MRELNEVREDINRADAELRDAFVLRMQLCREVALYKQKMGLPVLDEKREREVIEKNLAMLDGESLEFYYEAFLRSNMAISRTYQSKLIADLSPDTLYVGLADGGYPITVANGALSDISSLFSLKRRVFIITDDGIPKEYTELARAACDEAEVFVFPHGESSKSISTYESILCAMQNAGIKRTDAVLAVGGGVVTDLAAFAAATYMRGIDFYAVPTTLLAMLDASVGGKCGIDLGGIKNAVGVFTRPRGVLIDPTLLKTLDERQISAGLAEAIKMALTHDATLFEDIEGGLMQRDAAQLIRRALAIKIGVVERDERESGQRRILNFGQTLGHAIEASTDLLHGECVALGMIPMASEDVRARLIPLLHKIGLPTECRAIADGAKLIAADKKSTSDTVNAVYCDRIGEAYVKETKISELAAILEGGIK
jgi:3-dehydroquinate synthase